MTVIMLLYPTYTQTNRFSKREKKSYTYAYRIGLHYYYTFATTDGYVQLDAFKAYIIRIGIVCYCMLCARIKSSRDKSSRLRSDVLGYIMIITTI